MHPKNCENELIVIVLLYKTFTV